MFDVMVMTEDGPERVVESDSERLWAYAEQGCALQLGSCRVRRVDNVYSVLVQSTLLTVSTIDEALRILLGEQVPLSLVPFEHVVHDFPLEEAA